MKRLPGITINDDCKITIKRMLPDLGEVLVRRGQKIEALEVIARAELPSRYQVLNIAAQLGQARVDMAEVMLKAEGDEVEVNETIAMSKGGTPLLQRPVRAPAAGYIVAIGSGWVLLETERAVTELQAFVNGVVSRVIANRGVIIEANGAMITASCGFGGEAYGPFKRMVNRNSETVQPEMIDESVEDAILLGGQSVDEAILRAAEAAHVRGIIVGSIDASLLKLDPPLKIRVVATEGFGNIPMSPSTFGILGTLDGKDVSIRGSTPILDELGDRGEPVEPPLILSTRRHTPSGSSAKEKEDYTVGVGSHVRVIQGEMLGASGPIDSLPDEPQSTEAGLVLPGAYVKLYNSLYYIPWANLEKVV